MGLELRPRTPGEAILGFVVAILVDLLERNAIRVPRRSRTDLSTPPSVVPSNTLGEVHHAGPSLPDFQDASSDELAPDLDGALVLEFAQLLLELCLPTANVTSMQPCDALVLRGP